VTKPDEKKDKDPKDDKKPEKENKGEEKKELTVEEASA
jgi:hypothetical protein